MMKKKQCALDPDCQMRLDRTGPDRSTPARRAIFDFVMSFDGLFLEAGRFWISNTDF